MPEEPTLDQQPGVTRRNALLGLGAAAGAAAVVSAIPFKAGASSLEAILTQDSAADLGATIPGLTYVGIDAFAFTTETNGAGGIQRRYQASTGMEPFTPNNRIWAPLMIPAGSVVHQMNVGYLGQPIAEISRRKLTQPFPHSRLRRFSSKRHWLPVPAGRSRQPRTSRHRWLSSRTRPTP